MNRKDDFIPYIMKVDWERGLWIGMNLGVDIDYEFGNWVVRSDLMLAIRSFHPCVFIASAQGWPML